MRKDRIATNARATAIERKLIMDSSYPPIIIYFDSDVTLLSSSD
jgi:hypothetical protein